MTATTLPQPLMTTLSNGIRVVTQSIPAMQSAAIGIRINSSTRNEPDDLGGASHFIEHLLFKGTTRRSADRIMEEFDALGAKANAYTSQEEVFYYATALGSAVPATFELLADLYVNATLPDVEVEKERGVVLQEISMNQDNPGRYAYHNFHSGFWQGHPLGSPVLGTPESISAIPRDRLMAHKLANYTAGATIVSAAGNVDHAMVVALSEQLLTGLPGGSAQCHPAPPEWQPAVAGQTHHQRSMEQTQFYMGYPIPPAGSPHRNSLAVLNQILGSGMSSRLFREVRERRSLAYSVYSSMASYSDSGCLLIFAGTKPERAREAVEVCHGELQRFCTEPVSAEVLDSAKQQIRSKRLMALDDCELQVRRLANTTTILGEPEPLAPSLEAIAAVTATDVQQMAHELFNCVLPRVESVGPGDGPGLPPLTN
jgi:predicted Zn-dependent peptidase